MKPVSSLKGITPLVGSTIVDISFALKQEEYVNTPLFTYLHLIKETPSWKVLATDVLSLSLFLMHTHAVFIDFSKRMVLVETEDSKEFCVYYYNGPHLSRNLSYLTETIHSSFISSLKDFKEKIKNELVLLNNEKDLKKVWYHLVDFSQIYFQNIQNK